MLGPHLSLLSRAAHVDGRRAGALCARIPPAQRWRSPAPPQRVRTCSCLAAATSTCPPPSSPPPAATLPGDGPPRAAVWPPRDRFRRRGRFPAATTANFGASLAQDPLVPPPPPPTTKCTVTAVVHGRVGSAFSVLRLSPPPSWYSTRWLPGMDEAGDRISASVAAAVRGRAAAAGCVAARCAASAGWLSDAA